MSWVMVGITAGTAAMSMSQAAQKKKQQQRSNRAEAEVTRYSPWTEMRGQLDNSYVPDQLTAGGAGALQGMAIGQGLGYGGGAQKLQPTPEELAKQAQQAQVGQQGMSMNQNPSLYGNPWSGIS